ncbi:hypothetical protein G6L37_04040 [Agrobacterium rubi]|nr:hypothetical protein [Agrobacterium rubi]NTF24521.1 hypothetical protein [Agrobacterium rubi]
MTDLIIYDTEATDADKRHGQITQFSAVVTNLDMTSERYFDIRVRPLPWVVITPGALRVTKMNVEDLFCEDALSEFDAAARISEILRVPYGGDRIFVTFYGIDFDDELIRTTLYRNMQYPFQTTGRGAMRVDMLDGVRVLDHLQPGSINTVFDNEKGKLTWRLEKICPANGIEIDAHDALQDSIALTSLTRLVRTVAPWVWDVLVRAGSPSKVDAMIDRAIATGEPLFLFTHFGAPEIVPCFPMAFDGKRKHMLADLRVEAFPTDVESAKAVIGRKGTPFPIIKSNLSPIFVDYDHVSAVHDFDLTALKEKISRIKQNPEIRDVCSQILHGREFSRPANQTNEERIYDGFFDAPDKAAMRRFLTTHSWEERASLEFLDPRLDDFAARIVLDALYNGTASLSDQTREDLESRCADVLSRPFASADSRWATIASSLAQEPSDEWVEWATEYYGMDKDWGDDVEDSFTEQPVPARQYSFPF